MMGPDDWDIDVDPARELKKIFAPQADAVKVWKAAGAIKQRILQRLKRGIEAVQEMKDNAAQLNAKFIYSRMKGYRYYIEAGQPLPEDWSSGYRSDGKPVFYPPHSIAYEQARLQEALWESSSLWKITNDIAELHEEKLEEDGLSHSEAVFKQALWRMQYTQEDWIKSVLQFDGEFYVMMNADTPDLPECEPIKLSEYYRLKESLPAPAPQTTAQQKLEP